MKKFTAIFSVLILACLAFMLSASTQQGKSKEKQQQQKGHSGKADQGNKNNNGKGLQGINNNGHANNGKGQPQNNDHGNKNNQANEKGQKGKADKNKGYDENDNDNRGNNKKDKNKDYYLGLPDYRWDNTTYKDRNKFRKNEKVNICHKISNNKGGVNIRVSENAVKAHLKHGDVIGTCPEIRDRPFSDIFYSNQNNYYNNLQETQEQVSYSRSILDYALLRLTDGRSQLTTLQNRKAPLAEIERKQVAVTQLEQNVSLLETLIGVAVNVVANKLN